MKSIRGGFVVCMISVFALAACAPTHPKTGAISPFDGQWAGMLIPQNGNCSGSELSATGEIRYGFVVGKVEEIAASSARHYQIWGPIGPDNRLNASIGMAGITGGSADILFEGDSARGTWKSDTCGGTATLERVK